MIFRLLPFVLLFSFASCNISKQNTSVANSSNNNKAHLLFLNCLISHDSISQEYKISLINKIIAEGKIKENTEISERGEEQDFTYCLLNKRKKILSSIDLENPLDRTIEYATENGLLEKKNIRLEQAQFSLRIPLTLKLHFISFQKNKKQLLLIDVNQ